MKHESNRTVSSSLGDGEIPVFTTADGDGARPELVLIPAIFGVDEGAKTLVETITAPLSLHFGDANIATPVEAVASLRKALDGQDNAKIFLHEGGVEHGFADPGAAEFDPDVYKIGLAEIGRLLDGMR